MAFRDHCSRNLLAIVFFVHLRLRSFVVESTACDISQCRPQSPIESKTIAVDDFQWCLAGIEVVYSHIAFNNNRDRGRHR